MKEAARGHANMVRDVISVLRDTDLAEDMPFANRLIARTAADIVGTLCGTPRLIHDGEIHEITGQAWRDSSASDSGTTIWRVPTTNSASEGACQWCGSLYLLDGAGSEHRLCQPCYDGGPPTS